MRPAVVLVTGGCREDALQAARSLRTALPDVAVHVHDGAGEPLAAMSASSHLVLGVSETRAPEAPCLLADATVRSAADLDEFVRRVRDFDHRRRSHQLPPDLPPKLSPWSTSWSHTARRVGARIGHVLAAHGVTGSVEHIGSTSVRGLPAKAIIDLQISVTQLHQIDAVDSALRAAGFVNVQQIAPNAPGVRTDNPRGDHARPEQWAKRLYAGVDTDQRVIVHVRQAGAANWRYAILFRDWLRANDDARDEYARVKSDLAAAHSDDSNFDGYATAKEYWFDKAYQASESWAQRTRWQPGPALT